MNPSARPHRQSRNLGSFVALRDGQMPSLSHRASQVQPRSAVASAQFPQIEPGAIVMQLYELLLRDESLHD